MSPPASIALSVVVILICGGIGAVAGFALVTAAGWTGTWSAIVAAFVGMIVATLTWAGGVVMLRKLGWLK